MNFAHQPDGEVQMNSGSTTMPHLRCCQNARRDFVKRRGGFFQGEANEKSRQG